VNRFGHYQLRTTDVNAARAFYTDLCGADFWSDRITVATLPERAAARGAPAHWLGHIGVADVEATVGRFVVAGAERLGPVEPGGGALQAVLRDPFGAIVAVSSAQPTPFTDHVAWHLLHSQDEARAFATYSSLFGWSPKEAHDLGPELGRHQSFTWDDAARPVGSVANTARLPHIHPQWLFFFRVASLDDSLAKVRAHGGLALSPVQMQNGALVAPCDDPQGAAFGLYQAR
jgi:predicted enzyme related to lactoylglutathione lyase